MQNRVQLIAYADRLAGGGLRELRELLDGEFRDLFGGVHVLPFFTPFDGADAGFDPINHTEVDPRLGEWRDVRELGGKIDLMADVIVNHISRESAQFRDFVANGSASRHAGLFLTLDSVFPEGATEAELNVLYRPRPGLPLTVVTLASGERRIVWTTFTRQQIDIDVTHEQGCAYLHGILDTFARYGIGIIRLDAVGYAIKRAGTSGFLLPETYAFIDRLAGRARGLGMEVVVEVHSHFRDQIEIARRVDRVYDFQLPPLVLHAFAFRTSRYLKRWIEMRPVNTLTVLDTHDGIGIVDIGADARDCSRRPGLVPPDELERLIDGIHERTHGASRQATGAAASNVDLYQVNTTFYDAMGRDDRQYLLARAVQFFLPGIPQVYYVGLLAGVNDVELLGRTGVGRDINRHYYTRAEIARELQRPVVVSLLELIRLRNAHPAFNGRFSLAATDDRTLHLRWRRDRDVANLRIDLATFDYELCVSTPRGTVRLTLLERQ